MPIWSEVELAWRLSRPTKVSALARASPAPTARPPPPRCWSRCWPRAGLRTAAVGNIGRPIMEIVLDPEPYDVLAVELSSHQLHWSHSLALHSAAVLNLQPDHLEWHGSYQAYPTPRPRSTRGVAGQLRLQRRRPGHRADGRGGRGGRGGPGHRLHPRHPGAVDARRRRRPAGRPGLHRAAPRLGPGAGQDQPTSARPAPAQRRQRAGRGRAGPVVRGAGHRGPRRAAQRHGWAPTRSRRSPSGTGSAGSTTPRPPTRTRPTRPCARSTSVVWIAGGQAKGTTFDELVIAHRAGCGARCCSAWTGRSIAEALARHAPEVPVRSIEATDTSAMAQAVAAAASLATTRRCGAAGPGVRQQGHVHRLRRPRGRLRRRGTRAERRSDEAGSERTR